jgi:hypothetical protein
MPFVFPVRITDQKVDRMRLDQMPRCETEEAVRGGQHRTWADQSPCAMIPEFSLENSYAAPRRRVHIDSAAAGFRAYARKDRARNIVGRNAGQLESP